MLSLITHWLSANKLSLNVNKTKCMVFHSDKKKVLYPKLFIGAIEIERVDYFNFLGLQLNHTLKWNKQLSCESIKISKIAGLLHKLKSEYSTSILKINLYHINIAQYQLLHTFMGISNRSNISPTEKSH